MYDPMTFEGRLSDAYQRYLAPMPMTVDARATAAAAVAATRPAGRLGLLRTRAIVRLVVAAALLVAALGAAMLNVGHPAPSAVPTAAPRQNGPIILYGMSIAADGTSKALPIPSLVQYSCAVISPDGQWLAYLQETGQDEALAITRLDGTDRRSLWTGAFHDGAFHQVIWGADSTSVLASRIESGGIVIGRLDGQPPIELDWGNGEFPGTISLSPDGRRVAQIEGSSLVVHEVADGRGTNIASASDIGRLIAWSPDGSSIAYTAGGASGGESVHVVEADGTADRVVSMATPGATIGFISWSRDGRRLASVESTDISGPIRSMLVTSSIVDRTGEVVGHVAPFNASGQTLLFTWSPDGKDLLYTIGGGPERQSPLIAAVDLVATRAIDIGTYFYPACAPGWGPVAP